jgi:regulator of replication initiation timing
MIAEITSALQSAKVMNDLVQANRSFRNFNELSAAVYEINVKLMAAMTVAATLMEENATLKKENEQLKNWDAEKEHYTLVKVKTGFLAYALKPEVETREPRHYLCANCFTKGEKGILQFERVSMQNRAYCLRCEKKVVVW